MAQLSLAVSKPINNIMRIPQSRPFVQAISFSVRRLYSSSGPLIRQTSLPAPNTGHIRILSLNRPSARNALSRALLAELGSAIKSIAAEYDSSGSEVKPASPSVGSDAENAGPTRAVIVASDVDSCFCAGADLKERAGFSSAETTEFLTNLRNTFTALSELPVPTISAISSTALGGGLELALCTDLRVFASTAQVGLPETRLGIIPGAGGTYRLRSLVGTAKAMDLILTGRRIGAAEAMSLGIANRVVEVGETDEEGDVLSKEDILRRAGQACLQKAVSLATEICEGGPVAIRAALGAVKLGVAEQKAKDGLQMTESSFYERVVGTEDRNEALKAFKEKRKPAFKGR